MTPVKSGLDILMEKKLPTLQGQRVGLISHQASVDSRLRHVIDLFRASSVRLTALFAPEPGLWGSAQDQVAISRQKDPESGTAIFSLYGDQRYPPEDSLQNVDVLVCDLQDVGSRYYTFVWT